MPLTEQQKLPSRGRSGGVPRGTEANKPVRSQGEDGECALHEDGRQVTAARVGAVAAKVHVVRCCWKRPRVQDRNKQVRNHRLLRRRVQKQLLCEHRPAGSPHNMAHRQSQALGLDREADRAHLAAAQCDVRGARAADGGGRRSWRRREEAHTEDGPREQCVHRVGQVPRCHPGHGHEDHKVHDGHESARRHQPQGQPGDERYVEHLPGDVPLRGCGPLWLQHAHGAARDDQSPRGRDVCL
mmetsp:Transcript_6720/g.17460  ORF Transcript_6720/g.17460 Transcript_6720/m.17460 type:complete len:241 (-) Transcript_6720:231-953(-)